MLRASLEVDDREYHFEDEQHIRKIILLRRDPRTSEFPLLELYFEKENPNYQEPYSAYVGVGKKSLEHAVIEYTDGNTGRFYEGYIDFDVNTYKISDNKDKLKIVIDFKQQTLLCKHVY